MITLNAISKKIGARALFEDVQMTFNEGCRYGLTGPNGAGKSTLLKIMMGMEEPTSGSVSLPSKVGFLRQNIEDFYEHKVLDVVVMGNSVLWDALQKRDALYECEMTEEIGLQLGDLEMIIADEDGYKADSDAEILLGGMGVPSEYYYSTLGEIPAHMRFRVILCQALFGNPRALILDEPTNHLDLHSIGWLEGFLSAYKGVLITVSHDRHFLNSVCTHIADIDYETIIIYPGNYDQMVSAKSAARERMSLENKNKEKKIAQLQEFVSKFGAGTRASQVQSRMREMERLRPEEVKASNIQRPYIRFYPPEKVPGQRVFKIKNLCKSFDGKEVIKGFSCEILRGEKIAVIGNNGNGKSTFLKMIAQHLEPDSGEVILGHQVSVGYFPQVHSDLISVSSPITIFEWLKEQCPGCYDQDIRGVLGKVLFSGDDAFKNIQHLSGGESARLILAKLMLLKNNVLILDEPNNHLDLESVSALGWALSDFSGTVLFAAHDRDLIKQGATRLFEVSGEGRIQVLSGSIDDYLSMQSCA